MSAPSGMLADGGLVSGAAMAAMALASVGLWTLRVACAARGRKALGAALAAVEAVVFAVAFSSLAENLDSPVRVTGYALGVAAGTLLGLFLDERGSQSKSEIRIVVQGDDRGVAETLSGMGGPATSFRAEGPQGPVTVAFVAVDDRQVPHVVAVLDRSFPDAFWSIQRLRRLHDGASGSGLPPTTSPPVHPPSHRSFCSQAKPTRRRSHAHH